MATNKSVEAFRLGAKDYLNNDKFSDFTIVCEGKEFKVHRCFISVHSEYFERCCDGMFEVSHAINRGDDTCLLTEGFRRARPIESSSKTTHWKRSSE
jgi:hypothetical protein